MCRFLSASAAESQAETAPFDWQLRMCIRDSCAALHFFAQAQPIDAGVEARVVFNILALYRLPADTLFFQNDRVKTGSCGIQCGRIDVYKRQHLKRGKVHYALLPVWILNTRWEGKDFLFAMNGQTGKLVGNLPVSTKRVIGLFAAIAAPLIAISVTALLLMAR